MSKNVPWAVARLEDGRLVVAGQSGDSTCCRWDTAGVFGGAPKTEYDIVPFIGFPTPQSSNWNPAMQWGEGFWKASWFDLKPRAGGGFLTVGRIADTLLFTGTRRIWRGGQMPDSTAGGDWNAIFDAGGGGGIGVGEWSDSGMRLRLLRAKGSILDAYGWQILSDSTGFTIAGRYHSTSGGWVFDDLDSFAIDAYHSCFAYHSGGTPRDAWWVALPCPIMMPPEITRTRHGVWMTFNDTSSLSINPSAHPWYRELRPGLARIDPSNGRVLDSLHPFGTMQGLSRAIASDEEGNILVQGDQASDFHGPTGAYPLVYDTLHGVGAFSGRGLVSAGWLALLDSSGAVRKFRQLHGLENSGGWKLLRHPSGGWLGLSWDEKGLVGFSRLYHFGDSLELIDSSERLPAAVDLELGPEGEILLSGWNPARVPVASWLVGSGSMWVASCRSGSEGTTRVRHPGSGSLGMRVRGRVLEMTSASPASIRLRAYDPGGRLLLDRNAEPGARLDLPRGLSLWIAHQDGAILRKPILVP